RDDLPEVAGGGVSHHDACSPQWARYCRRLSLRSGGDQSRHGEVARRRGGISAACHHRGSLMFSTAVEVVLHIAFREAVSRRHAYLTLEHLLYALAHDPDGERILAACGVDPGILPRDPSKYPHDS